jgi:hypothetical protein
VATGARIQNATASPPWIVVPAASRALMSGPCRIGR